MSMDIQVAPVRSLLHDAASEFDELEAVRKNLDAQIDSLVAALEDCTDVANVVTRVGMETLGPDQSAIMVRCNNAVMGVEQAVNEYQQGDYEMVMNAQRAAASPPPNMLRNLHARHTRAVE